MSKKTPVDQVVKLAKQKLQTQAIAQRLGVSTNTITRVLKKEGFTYVRDDALTAHWDKV